VAWILKNDIAVPLHLIRAHFLVMLNHPKVRLTELDKNTLEIRPTVHVLFAKEPVTCISKGEILLTERSPEITNIQITLHSNSLKGFAILFPLLFIVLFTIFGHWVTDIPISEMMIGLWKIHVCMIAGSILIYILIKQAVIRYFTQILDRIREFSL
jgi:hypothetical protein